MQRDERDEHERQEARVQTKDPGEERSTRSKAIGEEATERAGQVSPSNEVRESLKAFLIVAQRAPCDDQQKNDGRHENAGPPRHLSRFLVGASKERVTQMGNDRQHQAPGREEVNRSNPITQRRAGDQVQHAVVGTRNGRVVVLRQVEARYDEYEEQKGRQPTQHILEAQRGAGHLILKGVQGEAFVQESARTLDHASWSPQLGTDHRVIRRL